MRIFQEVIQKTPHLLTSTHCLSFFKSQSVIWTDKQERPSVYQKTRFNTSIMVMEVNLLFKIEIHREIDF